MITDADAEKALHWLAQTDAEYGRLSAQVEAMDYRRKLVRAEALITADGKSAEQRQAQAESTPDYKTACREHVKAIQQWRARQAQRQTWALTIEMWRTQAASRRQGNV